MAQNVTIAGASYTDVPSIVVPKTGGGTAAFDDTTISSNAASASDIANGKLAYVNGTLIEGTATGGTAAISVVDTTDSHGGTIRTITALDISDTTAVASDVASGKYFYTAAGVKTAGTGSGGGSTLITKTITANGTYNASSDNADGYSSVTAAIPNAFTITDVSNTSGTTAQITASTGGATQHVIHFEFTDTTDADINVYYTDSLISTMITAYTPETYGQKTVDTAALDNVVWYTRPQGTWQTVYDGEQYVAADTPYPFVRITELASVSIPLGSVWRITLEGVMYSNLTAVSTAWGNMIGNPKYMDLPDDGSSIPMDLFQGQDAWYGGIDATAGTNVSIKIERLVAT